MAFIFEPQQIPEVILVKPKALGDARGFFKEHYKHSEFMAGDIPDLFIQDNHSRSAKNILRGLHYQKLPKPQAKLVSVIRGKILDVAVDIRKGSPNFGQYVAVELSDENHHQLYVPVGFAHGFAVLSDSADVFYKVNGEYSAEHDRGVLWNDPDIGIPWQIDQPLLSNKDQLQPLLVEADINFVYKENA
ncbi:MAG: dTDP-4-dehydrorhamnose 3,5-epimerase [Trueperaceae bacterium]